MTTYVELVSRLVYGTGSEGEITPNHRTWVQDNPNPSGTAWLEHHVDRMLPAYEAWLASENLPPVLPWTGEDPTPWETGNEVPLGPGLDGTFTGIGNLDALGAALRDRFTLVANDGRELAGPEKAPFSYRYWGYVKWASVLRDTFRGDIVVPPVEVRDRDGTRLSPVPFTNTFNQLHWNWHFGQPQASDPTPGFETSVGQHTTRGGIGLGNGEDFIKFHTDHIDIYNRWLGRTSQSTVTPRNMSEGWPRPADADQNPSTWTEPDSSPWANDPSQDDDLRTWNDLEELGGDNETGIHGAGHINNSDIGPIQHNNYVPRFHAWHGWIDNQWDLRKPRFGTWNADGRVIEPVFEPVLDTDDPYPGMQALTIVRDPDSSSDRVVPEGAVPDVDLATGSGTLRLKCYAEDPYDRPLDFELTATVYDGTSPMVGDGTDVETVTDTYTIGDTAAGDDFDIETEFVVPVQFGSAFTSDDPGGANPAVGFENGRIDLVGTLRSADPADPDTGFVHREETTIHLLGEKDAPEIDLYFDLSSFGRDQVESAMAVGNDRFEDVLIVAVQDRTNEPGPIDWPAEVSDEVKGLIRGRVPAAGLFGDPGHAPEPELVDPTTGDPVPGVELELASGPTLEEPTLADNLPQRYTYRYDVVFTSLDVFEGLSDGERYAAQVRMTAADRAGNEATETGQLRFFDEANPYMRDGDPSWLSIDTRVFRLFEGETKFDATLQAGQPNQFVQQVLDNLNTGSTSETFDDLPTNRNEAALEYSASITNRVTGETRNVHNFALAKVRLQGASGAETVRAFFRLFRYTASNLVFDPDEGYRTHDAGGGQKIPLLGFESNTDGAPLTSIPFFAAERETHGDPMTGQEDPTNVHDFPPGPSEERVHYFGVYLDINQSDARLPATYIGPDPDGGFSAGEVQPIRTLMRDAHQCMVVEIDYDGDPTDPGSTPANSDNLAQRNLVILTTDNPGDDLTHQVQHSFELDTGKRLRPVLEQPVLTHVPERTDGVLVPAPSVPMEFVSGDELESMVHVRAGELTYYGEGRLDGFENPDPEHVERARAELERERPLRLDAARWQSTGDLFDELLFDWDDLPDEAQVELYLPRVNCEHVINLRHLRHAPDDVRLVDAHTLSLVPEGATYVPLPPTDDDRIAGLVTVSLPEDVQKGQEYVVDVTHIRGGEERSVGGFTLDIQVSEADAIVDAEIRLLVQMADRLAVTPPEDIWYPVLARRVDTIRARAAALADSAGIDFEDPTVRVDRETGETVPLDGPALRVVLERIRILDDQDTWLKGAGELSFTTTVYSPSNGGVERTNSFPESGTFSIDAGEEIHLDATIFEGRVADELRVRIDGVEADTFDPDDTVGSYTRVLSGPAIDWFGSYRPDDEHVDPEDMNAWQVWYRIEPV
ncbi:hypothetical protein [Salinigranum salinum]|uniref:hypothetical protein n=1 Tax=Salinigranum salinum TaxID=1364937 RepID=UPI00126086D1|nr:hypothetical protein [Salinigranum salinum]